MLNLQRLDPGHTRCPETLEPGKVEADENSPLARSPVDDFFKKESALAKNNLLENPLWTHFRTLPEKLLTYVFSEKHRMAMHPGTRNVLNEQGEIIVGITHDYDASDDNFHPKYLHPFTVNGYWIPCTEGELLTTLSGECSVTRTVDGQREILFLVHPKSEKLYAPLIDKYKAGRVKVPALSLSSFRTLLIALEGQGSTEYAMVKVSLDETIGRVRRLLHRKECTGSVASASVLGMKPTSPFTIMNEDLSFTPGAFLVDPTDSEAQFRGAGMIHRSIPSVFTEPNDHRHIIPLYALFGDHNWVLLNTLIEQSGKKPTQFITDFILKPIAEAMVEHIYVQRFYLEFHGQNVLLLLTTGENNRLDIKFIYRDMGGVNCILNDKEESLLPENLRDHAQYWSKNFIKDAGDIMEGISKKVLFNLTKVLFKHEPELGRDENFCAWCTDMIEHGYQGNWIDDLHPDGHRKEHTRKSFYRYGYFDKIFAKLVLDQMNLHGIFVATRFLEPKPKYDYESLLNCIDNKHIPFQPSLHIEWFKNLVTMTLPDYYQFKKQYNS